MDLGFCHYGLGVYDTTLCIPYLGDKSWNEDFCGGNQKLSHGAVGEYLCRNRPERALALCYGRGFSGGL